ncbi:MAG TPA: methylmalonyl Co-A mutase-associated GTPase MeaB [Longimicrobiales bacterium]|nr:methylmalonyl Co-A mutase-associated GTPase MeaB [Longimicrobiales bacterium]
MTPDVAEKYQPLLERFRDGKRIGLARAITVVENEQSGFEAFLHEVLSAGPQGARVGVTGPPGAGKSSLISMLAAHYRKAEEHVGVVAVDPTSPYSGGALLGDRIRMNDLATDPGIFIRSMATRGSLGGLATTSKEVIDLMDAFGLPRILIETVGVGQTELDVTGAADTVVVVLVPESGDGVQAMKAGLMEIADIFVVNKADRPGADRLLKELSQAIHLRTGPGNDSTAGGRDMPAHHGVDMAAAMKKENEERGVTKEPRRWEPPEGWQIPVLKTVAQTGEGVPELVEAIASHRDHLVNSGELATRRRARTERRVRDVVERRLRRRAEQAVSGEALHETMERILGGSDTPYSVASGFIRAILDRELEG